MFNIYEENVDEFWSIRLFGVLYVLIDVERDWDLKLLVWYFLDKVCWFNVVFEIWDIVSVDILFLSILKYDII